MVGLGLTASLLLSACGGSPNTGASKTAAGGGSSHPAAKASKTTAGAHAPKAPTTTTTAAACATGTAASGILLTVQQEPAKEIATPKGKCWASIPYTPIAKLSTGTVPSGAKAQFKTAWTPKDLYILAYVQKWPLYYANQGATHDDDTVEFYLAGNDTFATSYGPLDCQYNVVFNGTVSKTTTCNTGRAGTPVTRIVKGTGYYDELIVPWSMLKVANPAKGQEYAFSLAVDLASSTGKRLAQIEWAGGKNNDWSETKNWGNITLG